MQRPDSWIPLYNQACLASEGDPARALDLLGSLRGKTFLRTDLLGRDQDLAPVRHLSGFAPLLAELQANEAQERRRHGETTEAAEENDGESGNG